MGAFFCANLGRIIMTAKTTPTLELGILPSLVGFHLRMAQVMVFKDFEQALAGLEVTPAIFGVLEILSHNQGLTQTRLAVAIGLDRSSLVPLLDKLQKRQLVAREASAEDRRSNNLAITPQGEALLAEATRRVAEHERRVLSGLGKAEVRQLINLLNKLGRAPA
jgi:DNA-binding MarR family transcriptional regulator